MKSYINILLILILFSTTARGQETDYAISRDSSASQQNVWVPTGLRVGADILGPTLSAFNDSRSFWEFNADLDFKNFYFVTEFGYATANEAGSAANYTSNGSFFRVGPDVNFMGRDKELHVFLFGVRFSKAFYKETLAGSVEDQTWGTTLVDLEQSGRSSNWVEMTTGLKVRVWRGVFAGYTLRFKFSRFSSTDNQQFESFYVPGYGLADHINNWSFNYYLYYRFQWSKKPIKWKDK